MKDDLTRRDFLRAAGLAAAGIAGAAVLSRSAGAQEQEPKKDEKDEKDEKKDPKQDDKGEGDSSQAEETRACPQCGSLMYKQGRTWTCENCGYSYVE
jgi:ribosomal protein S27AE